jgi:hypothetical protein
MVVRRCTWFYRLSGQMFAQPVTFEKPVTAGIAMAILRRTVGVPVELWGRKQGEFGAEHR